MAEGNSYSNLLRLIKSQGYNKDVNVIIAGIKSVSPLKVRLGDLTLEEDDFMATETGKKALGSASTSDRLLILVDGDDFYIIDKVVDL
jgi:Protein of unknown function (DUF2577)